MATRTKNTMPDRAECVAMIEAVAKGGNVDDLTFMLQAVCLELMEMRTRDSETVDILKECKIGYLPHYNGEGPWLNRLEPEFTSRRPQVTS